MVDIETLGRLPGSVILSIGAVQFGDVGFGESFYRTIDVFDSLTAGLKIDESTIEWWRTQPESARAVAQDRNAMRSLDTALAELGYFVGSDDFVWAKGPDFDLVLLQSAYTLLNKRIPWKYKNARDVRTILSLTPDIVKDIISPKKHHALTDAKDQAVLVIAAYKTLGLTLD